jgi:hypothetical protein
MQAIRHRQGLQLLSVQFVGVGVGRRVLRAAREWWCVRPRWSVGATDFGEKLLVVGL